MGAWSHPGCSLSSPLFRRLLETQIIYKLMFILVLLLRLTYCQSSQVTGMLAAVKKQFVSTELQLKYYQAAILDWQCSEDLLNSQQLPLAEAGIWQVEKCNAFTYDAGPLVSWWCSFCSCFHGCMQRAMSRGQFLEGEFVTHLKWIRFSAVPGHASASRCVHVRMHPGGNGFTFRLILLRMDCNSEVSSQ